MSSHGRAEYSPLQVNKCEKGRFEPADMVLPPLIPQQTEEITRRLPDNLPRRLIVAVVAVATLASLIAVVCAITSLTRRPAAQEDLGHTKEPNQTEDIREEDNPSTFASDLDRVYNSLMDRKTPTELADIFEYYRSELYDVNGVDDFREFMSVLRSDGLSRYPNGVIYDNDIRYAFRRTGELVTWYRYLRDLESKLMGYRVRDVPPPNVRMDPRKRREFDRVVDEWTRPADIVATSSRVIYKKNVVTLSEVAEWLKSDPDGAESEVMVFASRVLYLDADLTLPGVNLAMVAPVWMFVHDVNVTLDGIDGVEYAGETARDDRDGLPGDPGTDGGHFFALGQFDENLLHIRNNGGSGGNGQNGARGRDGTPTLGSKPSYGCLEETSRSYRNKNGKVVRVYKVFETSRCGGNGTNGGDAGRGGSGGETVVANSSDGSVTIRRAANGPPGRPGKGGAGGLGLPGGKMFYADGIDGETPSAISLMTRSNYSPSGLNGSDGITPVTVPSNASQFVFDVMREYRNYAWEQYLKGNNAAWMLLRTFDASPELSAVTPITELVADVDAVDNVEFYDSIIERINAAMDRSPELLTYLKAYAAAKRIRLRQGLDKCVIVDLDVYLENVARDLADVNATILRDDDRATPVLLRLLTNKVAYLNESCDAWKEKSARAIQSRRRLAEVTSAVIDVVKRVSSQLLDAIEVGSISPVEAPSWHDSNNDTDRFGRHRSRVVDDVAKVTQGGPIPTVRARLTQLRKSMTVLNDLVDPEGGDVARFPFEIEHLEAALDLAETIHGRVNLGRYVRDADAVAIITPDMAVIREKLFDVLVMSQYREALSIFRQWVFPNGFAYDNLLPKHKNGTSTLDEARNGLKLMRKWLAEYRSTIAAYDKYIREADFGRNNSVGPFFRWRNRDVHSDLGELFSGRTIILTADVVNSHVLAKSAIKFRTVRLELTGPSDMENILCRIQVEMKHSGYSYYYHRGRSHLRVGEEMDLSYSYELGGNGVPVNFNMVYKKLMDGPPVYSPYTTWTVRLRPVAEVRKLLKYVNETDLILVGAGSYIQTTDDDA